MPARTSRFHVGSDQGQVGFFGGAIDEPAVYARALSAAEVERHYAIGRGLP